MFKNKEQASQEVCKVLKKIQNDEETISKLFEAFLKFQRRSSKTRNAYDQISKCVYESANVMKSGKEQILNLAMNFAQVGDSEDDLIAELDNVLAPFSLFKNHCHTLKSEINHIYDSSKDFDKTNMTSKTQKWIEDRTEAFETKKINDFKNVLSHFIKTELAFHVEMVEIYSSAYKEILKINTDKIKDSNGSVEKPSVERNLATFLKLSPEGGKNAEKSGTEESTECSESEEDSFTENSNLSHLR